MALTNMALIFVCLAFMLYYHNGEAAMRRRKARIVDGNVAEKGMFPYVGALMEIKNASFIKEKCTFSIITTKTALSAGHCAFQKDGVTVYNVAQIFGILGVIDRKNDSRRYQFSNIFVHPNYNGPLSDDDDDDISMFIFNEEIQINQFIKPVPLIGNGVQAFEVVTVIGWGTLSETAKPGSNSILHYITLSIASYEFCGIRSQDKAYCIQTYEAGFCTGDSGGPNIISHSGREVQAGISVYVLEECALSYSVSILVSGYQDWIKAHVIGTPEFITQ